MIDPRISLETRVPDIGGGIGRTLLTAARLNSIPAQNALFEAQTERAQTQTEAADARLAEFEQKKQLMGAVYTHQAVKNLKSLPFEQRDEAYRAFGEHMSTLGYDVSSFDDDLSDANLTAMESSLAPFAAQAMGQAPAGVKEFEAMLASAASDDPLRAQAARVGLGVDPRASTSATERIATDPNLTDAVAGSQGTIARSKAQATGAGTSVESRRDERIVFGQDAAGGIPTLKRALQLLERVETGGIDAVSLAIRQRLGVEGADEGELSSKLGKAVLSQLRATFGAQFTEREGARLERIEAGFGKSTATNKRLLNELLQVSQDYADQAIKDAVEIEDFATAAAIKRAREFEFNEDFQLFGDSFREGQTATGPNGEKIVYRSGQWVQM